jgi:hypothetical protein
MLNEFIVLGLVPGTSLQITFSELLTACIALPLLAFCLKQAQLIRRAQYTRLYISLYLSTKKGQQLSLRLPA